MRDQRVLHIEDTSQIERSKWVLDSPNPPPLWKKLLCSLKETLLPHGNKLCFSSKNKSFHAHAYSFLQSLFPILVWLKDYTASKFKDDLLAGLTLASLCIPQVGIKKYYFCLACVKATFIIPLAIFILFFNFSFECCRV